MTDKVELVRVTDTDNIARAWLDALETLGFEYTMKKRRMSDAEYQRLLHGGIEHPPARVVMNVWIFEIGVVD